MRNALISLTLCLAAPALATPADSYYAQGQFSMAASAAKAAGDHLMAARATLIQAAFQASTKAEALSLLDGALAEIAAAPQTPDAQLQHALIIGYRGKLKRNAGDAKQARKEMEAVVAAAPNNALAYAALGGWHGDAIIDVGAMLAGMALGAKKDEARKGFETAIAKDPSSPVYPTYYALLLLRLDKNAGDKAQALLQSVAGLRAKDGFEALMKARAAQVLVPLKAGNVDQARALAVQLAPFGKVVGKV